MITQPKPKECACHCHCGDVDPCFGVDMLGCKHCNPYMKEKHATPPSSPLEEKILEFRKRFGYENLVGVERERFEHQEQFISEVIADCRVEERKLMIQRFIQWMRMENDVAVIHKDEYERFINSL